MLSFFRQEQSDQSFDLQHFLICFHNLVVTSLTTKLKNKSLRLLPDFGRRRVQKAYTGRRSAKAAILPVLRAAK